MVINTKKLCLLFTEKKWTTRQIADKYGTFTKDIRRILKEEKVWENRRKK